MRVWAWAVALVMACDHDNAAGVAPSVSAVIPLPSASATTSTSPSAGPIPSATTSTSAIINMPGIDAGMTCGKKPLPDCPLQGWMKKNMQPPMDAKDWQGIADALTRAGTLGPLGYTNWVSISNDGANAAKAADMAAIKAACRGCHDQYKNKYRAEMRTRPIP